MMNRELPAISLSLFHSPHISQRSAYLMSCPSKPVLDILRGIHTDRDIAGRIIGQLNQIRPLHKVQLEQTERLAADNARLMRCWAAVVFPPLCFAGRCVISCTHLSEKIKTAPEQERHSVPAQALALALWHWRWLMHLKNGRTD